MDMIGGARELARRRGETFGACINTRCARFERVVPAREGDTCPECAWHLMHESGLTWADAREKGYNA